MVLTIKDNSVIMWLRLLTENITLSKTHMKEVFKDNKFTGKGIEKGRNFTFQGFFENGSRKEGILEWEDESGKYRYEGHFN